MKRVSLSRLDLCKLSKFQVAYIVICFFRITLICLAKVDGLAKEKVMVYEAEAEFSIDALNNINDTVWFRVLNTQPKY